MWRIWGGKVTMGKGLMTRRSASRDLFKVLYRIGTGYQIAQPYEHTHCVLDQPANLCDFRTEVFRGR
jgi:hypothetical protein